VLLLVLQHRLPHARSLLQPPLQQRALASPPRLQVGRGSRPRAHAGHHSSDVRGVCCMLCRLIGTLLLLRNLRGGLRQHGMQGFRQRRHAAAAVAAHRLCSKEHGSHVIQLALQLCCRRLSFQPLPALLLQLLLPGCGGTAAAGAALGCGRGRWLGPQ
jgi:hypothetical protein